MPRAQNRFLCQQCGLESPRWLGRCPRCDEWDTFVEERAPQRGVAAGAAPAASSRPRAITDVAAEPLERISSGIPELDGVLGGGLVPGAVVLVGGDPGIGKSTLLTQAAHSVAAPDSGQERTVLYVSGEESPEQIRIRGERLGALTYGFLLCAETDVDAILRHLEATQPALAVIDSIQTLQDGRLESAPGTVSQVRDCAARLARFARGTGTPLVLIGHVTKEGSLAGPRVLEHIVDTVLYFEGDRRHAYRLLRAAKNRFGSTDELGIFEMRETGLVGVENPSSLLLAERAVGGTGSAVTAVIEGTRALLVEVQALVCRSILSSPRRVVTGMDPGRVNMLLAVLEKRMGLRLGEQDVFVNVAGGIRISEPAGDLAAALAVLSSFREQPLAPDTLVVGEVALTGDVRAVSQVEKRLREAARQGFARAIAPRHNLHGLPEVPGLRVTGAHTVLDAATEALMPASGGAE